MWPFKVSKKICLSCEKYKLEIQNLIAERDLALQDLQKAKDFMKPISESWKYSDFEFLEDHMPVRTNIEDLSVSLQCYDLVKHFEKFYAKSYVCPGGELTIGYGHTRFDKEPYFDRNSAWTEEYASDVLEADLQGTIKILKKYVKVPLYQHEFDALISWTFNLGSGSLSSSTMLERLNEQKYREAADEMLKWDKTGGKTLAGLTRRRKSENYLFCSGNLDFFENV